MSLRAIIPAVIITGLLAGCASGKARNILVEKDGGIISIPVTERSSAERANREKALALMEAKCGRKFEITREEEVEVGFVEETALNSESFSSSNKMVVRSKKSEYRLWYRCQ